MLTYAVRVPLKRDANLANSSNREISSIAGF